MSPVYETIKEGPSHEPSFRSTVILNNVRYDSLPGFLNRKTAEQSAAEVALIELSKSADMKFGISQPVHQTGLCKNLLQEYAQKMNYAMPLYECYKEEKKQGRAPMYSCTVEIGGTKYIGASASSKKEAEIKAARTALLAIQSAPYFSEDHTGNSIYTVIPLKKKVSDLGISTQETSAALKPKKSRFKKQQKRKCASKRACFAKGTMASEQEANLNGLASLETGVSDDSGTQEKEAGGFEVNIDGQAVVETSVTNVVSFQLGTDSGHGVVETTANVSYEEFYNGNMENSLVQVDGGVCRDGESSRMDVHP
ncbi:hypothetical protein ACJIZ3_012183 [Penstemon smallii]|uniref:DRBM domain-containing protein n=1 Tax=Penstemon smallii TaxID=265156 RepID=A0ABD3UMU8_9LAMI